MYTLWVISSLIKLKTVLLARGTLLYSLQYLKTSWLPGCFQWVGGGAKLPSTATIPHRLIFLMLRDINETQWTVPSCHYTSWSVCFLSLCQVYGVLPSALQHQLRLLLWEECQLLWLWCGGSASGSSSAQSQDHHHPHQPSRQSLLLVPGPSQATL